MSHLNIPESVLKDPKTGKHPETAAEFAAQNARISDYIVRKAAQDAAKRLEEGN